MTGVVECSDRRIHAPMFTLIFYTCIDAMSIALYIFERHIEHNREPGLKHTSKNLLRMSVSKWRSWLQIRLDKKIRRHTRLFYHDARIRCLHAPNRRLFSLSP